MHDYLTSSTSTQCTSDTNCDKQNKGSGVEKLGLKDIDSDGIDNADLSSVEDITDSSSCEYLSHNISDCKSGSIEVESINTDCTESI